MDRDERLNGEGVDLRPLVGLLDGLPSEIVEHLTEQAILTHRELVNRAETLFDALPEAIKSGKQAGGEAHLAYLQATIEMHAQMSALTTLLHLLGRTPNI